MGSLFYFAVSFLASIAGAICGIGGGVIIKPVLDLFGWDSVSTISFLSGCTVLSMSCYNVGKTLLSSDNSISFKTGTPLALGAAVGGVTGNQIFRAVKQLSVNPNTVGAIQAACLALVTIGTLLYTVFKSRIKTYHLRNSILCLAIGLVLGILSSFLGIGGGPINLVVLYFFFSMDTKTAAQNSLYIILFSQITNLLTALLTRSVPEFHILSLILMVVGGICGGIVGRNINKKLDNRAVERLFLSLMVVIILISCWNIWKYMLGI